MYNVKYPRIHLSKVIDYDVKKKTYTITDDMVFDSEEELIDFLARYHYPKYNFAGNEIPGEYKNKYMDCQALTGYSRNSHLYDFVMNKPLKPSDCKEINYDWILCSYIFWFDTKEMPNFDVRNLKDKVERRYKEKQPEWDKYGWLRWNGITGNRRTIYRQHPKSHKNSPWRRDCRYIQRARAAYGMEAEEEYKEFVKVKDKRYRSIWPDEDFRGYGSSGWKDNPGNKYRHQWEAKTKRDFEKVKRKKEVAIFSGGKS